MIRVVHGTKGGTCFVSGNYRKKQDIQGAFGCVHIQTGRFGPCA